MISLRKPAIPVTSSETRYIPELDGLRCVAVAGVIAFHLGLPGSMLGWVGVFLFFVLSGFLITGILLDHKDETGYFRIFYGRRAIRIFPIYYLSLTAVFGLALWQSWSTSDFPYFLTYLQNYVLGVKSFEASFPAAFNHTWSLAVEEQFYLIWPFAVFFLSRRCLTAICGMLICLAIVARLGTSLATENADLCFTPLICVVDSLGAGALLAILCRSEWKTVINAKFGYLMLLIGLTLSAAIVLLTGHNKFWRPDDYLAIPGTAHLLFTATSLAFVGLIIVALDKKSNIARVLRLRPLPHLGKVSYGLYLYHVPVLIFLPALLRAFGCGTLRRASFVAIYFVVLYLVTMLSWTLVEKQFGRLKRHFEYQTKP